MCDGRSVFLYYTFNEQLALKAPIRLDQSNRKLIIAHTTSDPTRCSYGVNGPKGRKWRSRLRQEMKINKDQERNGKNSRNIALKYKIFQEMGTGASVPFCA